MKAILPHAFFLYAKQFSLESIIEEIAKISFDIGQNKSKDFNDMAGYRNYSVSINGHTITNRVMVVQTWLIDLVHDVVQINNFQSRSISYNEALHLILLHNDYCNKGDGERIKNHSDALFYLYGFFGEQKRFEEYDFTNDYSREEYILENISTVEHPKNTYNINFCQEFKEITGFFPKVYSTILFALYGQVATRSPIIYFDSVECEFKNPYMNSENFLKILDRYSCTIEELVTSALGRQLLYTKPFIKFNNRYISVNPFLVLCLFTNSNYWVMRNYYLNSNGDKQKFVNAFGKYFEIYVEEVFTNCLNCNEFENIAEEDKKRADWHLKIGDYDFLIEQKSTISILGIKQNKPNIEQFKMHIKKTWAEAFEQLYITERDLALKNSIKIILLYEDYYLCESLDLLYELRQDLKEKNDNRYWLMTIKELEMLFYTYKLDPDKFFEIVKEKDEAEFAHSNDGRSLIQFLQKHDVKKNLYLKDYGILEQYNILVKIASSNLNSTYE